MDAGNTVAAPIIVTGGLVTAWGFGTAFAAGRNANLAVTHSYVRDGHFYSVGQDIRDAARGTHEVLSRRSGRQVALGGAIALLGAGILALTQN